MNKMRMIAKAIEIVANVIIIATTACTLRNKFCKRKVSETPTPQDEADGEDGTPDM